MEYGDADLPEVLQQVEGIWLDRVDDNDQQAARLPIRRRDAKWRTSRHCNEHFDTPAR